MIPPNRINVGFSFRTRMAIHTVKKGLTLKIAELLVGPSKSSATSIIQAPIPGPITDPIMSKANEDNDGVLILFLVGRCKNDKPKMPATADIRIAFAENGGKYWRLNPNP